MRKLIIAIAAFAASLIAVPASAQSLGDILGVVAGVSGGGYEGRSPNGFVTMGGGYGYNNGCYGSGTVSQIACRVEQVEQMRRQREYRRQQQAYEQRQQFDQRSRQIEALQRACKAGDQVSCQRSGGSDERSMAIARALMDACQAGDRDSCRRAEGMMGGDRATYGRYTRR